MKDDLISRIKAIIILIISNEYSSIFSKIVDKYFQKNSNVSPIFKILFRKFCHIPTKKKEKYSHQSNNFQCFLWNTPSKKFPTSFSAGVSGLAVIFEKIFLPKVYFNYLTRELRRRTRTRPNGSTKANLQHLYLLKLHIKFI